MSGVAFNFDASKVAPNTGGATIVPTGTYDVQITKTDMKPTRDGSGAMLVVSMTVLAGDYRGAVIVDRLNLQNSSATAVEIAYGTLSAICHVTGVMAFQNTAQLHGRPFKVNVECKPRESDPSKMSNDVKGYLDANGNEPGASGNVGASAPVPPAAPAAPASTASPAPAPTQPVSAPAPAPAPAAAVATPPAAYPAPAPAPAPAPSAPPWAS